MLKINKTQPSPVSIVIGEKWKDKKPFDKPQQSKKDSYEHQQDDENSNENKNKDPKR